jgi:hypothetical protein
MGRTTILAFRLLQIALVVLLAGAGADKIFQASLDWDQYLPAFVPWLLGVPPAHFIAFIGAVELLLAFGLTLAPKLFGPISSIWLLLISFALVSGGKFIGLGLLNLVLAILAFAEGSLAEAPSSGLHRHTFFLKRKRFLRPVAKYPRSLAAR